MNRTLVCLLLAASAGTAAALSPAEIFDQRSPSIFVVHAYDKQGRKVSTGSAVVIGPEQLVTNCHVLAKASGISVSRGNISYGASLEWPDPARDLCQLRVKELAAPATPLGDTANLKVGQRVFAIGAPHGLELTLSDGLVSSLRELDEGKPPLVQTTAPVSPGSSGGALFDEAGRLVGITTFNFRGQQLNFAVPVEWVRELPARGRELLAKRKAQAEARAAAAKVGMSGTAVAALAPIDPTLPKEMPQAGDSWTYVALDLTYKPGDRSRKFVHTVRNVNRGSIVEAVTREGAQLTQDAFSPEMSAIYRANAEMLEVAPYATAFRRLQPGEKWGSIPIRGLDQIGTAGATGEEPYAFENARVVGSERVTVAAGTFDAIRVDLDGRMSNILMGGSAVIRGYTSFKQSVWYAAQVKRAVKLVLETPRFTTSYELESYSLR